MPPPKLYFSPIIFALHVPFPLRHPLKPVSAASPFEMCFTNNSILSDKLKDAGENCTFKLTPWSRIIFEKLIVAQIVKKLPAFYETLKRVCLINYNDSE